jgi:hypothetical protein
MSSNDDFIGRLEDYLDSFDGATPLPDRVRDAIRAELPSARQVRTRPGPLRLPTMLSNSSASARLGLGAAAIVVAVVLGGAFLNNGRSAGSIGGAPTTPPATATTAPTLAPTPPASAAAEPLTLRQAPPAPCDPTDTAGATCVAPGTYQLNDSPGSSIWPVTVTVDVPVGWFDWDAAPGADALLVGSEVSGWGVMFATVGDVSRDPCDATKGVIPAAQVDTPQKLAAAMAAWPKFTETTPKQIVVDGHDGLQFQLTSSAGSSCSVQGAWLTTSGYPVDAYPMIWSTGAGAPGTFEIVDTGHGLLVIRTTDFPQTSPNELVAGMAADPTRHAADLTELHAILDSIRLTARPASR